ncbi:MAG: ATP-binding cassette domain-containing protein [Clostridium sp.]|nr:ATP-binding cassette domain-containing protein [Clostridium sp.]
MLELKNVNVHYGAIHALQGINIKVNQGEIVTLIGANGAGKSTTLKAISGVLKPTTGEILFEGNNIAKMKSHNLVSFLLFPPINP